MLTKKDYYTMNKKTTLQKISREIENCKACKTNKIGKAVPGEGGENAKVVFIGEAPGKKEAESGRPFVGRSGKFLREAIKNIGLRETDFFITSSVKYLPTYVTPTRKDIEHGATHLRKQLEIINPKVIVLLGCTACKSLLEEQSPIKECHGTFIKNCGKTYFVTYHPAAIIRFPKYKKDFLEDFKKLKSLIS